MNHLIDLISAGAAGVAGHSWKLELALGSCFLLGLRHGFDYDHLAAISDITAVQRSRMQGLRLGVTYALGHAMTVVLLGAMVIMLHVSLPARLDAWTERLIGVTLIVLGIGVVADIFRRAHSHAGVPSRLALLISGCQYVWWRSAKIFGSSGPQPSAWAWNYNEGPVFGIGVLHGLGAETPSQLMLFLLAASLGGTGKGFLGLLAFAVGLVLMNTLMTGCMGTVFGAETHRPRLYRVVAAGGAVYSFVVGAILLLGASDKLPALSH